jgi:hypothetical protein
MNWVRAGVDIVIDRGREHGKVRQHKHWWPGGAILAVWLVCAALAACGTTTPPTAIHQCGTVHVAAGRVLPQEAAAASAAESCFAHAYATCQPAALTFTSMGVDTGATQTFIEHLSNGQCTVTDSVQGYTANGGGKTFPTQTYTCSGMQQQADGLHFTDCGQEGDVLVPAPSAR